MSAQHFNVGDRVRVRAGVADPDFAWLKLAGWAGVVREIDTEAQPPIYLVAWGRQTLAAAPRKYHRQCDNKGLDAETTWLAEADLEADTSDQVFVPPPPPLDLDDPEDRARHVLGLSSDADLPPVTVEHLARFHRHLGKNLKLPFPAGLDVGETQLGSGLRPVMVLRILPAEQSMAVVGLMAEVALDESHGEVPLAVLQPAEGDPAEKDLAAYAVWIAAHLPQRPARSRAPLHPLVLLGVGVALLGGVVGACVATVSGAVLAAELGAVVLGAIGFFVGVWYERMFRLVNRLPPGVLGGALLGLLAGAGAGAAVGAASLAYLGSVPGAIAGSLLSWLLERLRLARLGYATMTFLGAGVGAVVLSMLGDLPDGSAAWPAALTGLGVGLLAGVLAALALCGGVLLYLSVVFRYEDSEG